MIKRVIFIFFIFISYESIFCADTTDFTSKFDFSGQLIGWTNYNPKSDLELSAGLRTLPQLNYKINFSDNTKLDFEASANILGNLNTHPFDSIKTDGKLKPYRLWARYSGEQFELRAGLQKINFGSSLLIRPLMWFDAVDPRDPLQLTDGVWGLLGRYYFLNNANIWLWGLYGNTEKRPWDIGETFKGMPEIGGRIQYPLPLGEIALSYHFRDSKYIKSNLIGNDTLKIPEHRIGFDGKFDVGVGIWFEAVQISKTKNIGILTNQSLLNLGTDYTFDVGNGIYVVLEHLIVSYNEELGIFNNSINFTALSANYPIGINDNLNFITYYDWEHKDSYNFVNWQHTVEPFKLYLMGYWNPEKYYLPQQGESGAMFAGYGVQFMCVWNY